MEIRQLTEGETTILEPIGRLEGKHLALLEETIHGLIGEARNRFVIDLANVERIHSRGLRLLLGVARRLGASDGALVLCSLNEEVQEVFDTVGLARVFSITSSRDEAIRFVQQGKGKAREISRLAAELLGVGEKAAKGAAPIDDTADAARKRRLSTLAAGLLAPPGERPASGEGAAVSVTLPMPAQPPDSEIGQRSAAGRGLFSRLWSHLLKR